MATNMSEIFDRDFSSNVYSEYMELLLYILSVIVITGLYYICYCRFRFRNFPCCSLELFLIYVRVTGRYIKELPLSFAALNFAMAVCKYFQKEGIVLIWFLQPNLAIFHERYVKILLNDDASIDKPLVYDIISDMVGKSILTINGSEWKQSKKTLQPLFRFDKLRSSVEILNEKAENIVKNIAKKGKNSVIDVLPILKIEILKAFCETMLDTKMDDEDTELYEYIKTTSSLGKCTVHRFIQPWLWWKHSLLFYEEGRKQLKQYKKLRNFSKKILRNVMQNSDTLLTKNESTLKQKKKVLYSIFSAKLAKDPDFSVRDAEDAINVLLFAGHDTTSYAIMWCLFMLGLHQDVQEKAFEEINLVTKQSTGFISYDDLKNLKYLECIIKETLRLYPVVPFFARKTTKELKLGNYIVPKNTSVFVVTYMMHRNPDSFPDPEAFNPERFYENTVENPWNYVPFAEGIRSCVGKAFAMMEMKIMLAHILRHFKVTSLDKREDILLDIRIVLTPLTPIRLQFSDRRNASLM